jgi:hypothetical protein
LLGRSIRILKFWRSIEKFGGFFARTWFKYPYNRVKMIGRDHQFIVEDREGNLASAAK